METFKRRVSRASTRSASDTYILSSQGNVLVDNEGSAVWTDFGLAGVVDPLGRSLVTKTGRSGAAPYKAPELHDPQELGYKEFRRTTSTDVYAFASLCLEVSSTFLPSLPSSHDAL